MIPATDFKPRYYPIFADLNSLEIDRAQEITSTTTLNRTKIQEIGRSGLVDWRKTTPTVTVNIRQLEYGSLEFWRALANKGPSVSQINWTDFATAAGDVVVYQTDDSGTFLGTGYYPSLRLASFNLNIGSPDALIERSFGLSGEAETLFQNNNKYLVSQRYVIASSGNNQTVSISAPTPVADPDNSGRYLERVVKYSGGTATELADSAWSYDGAGTLTINGSSTAGDVIRVWYSAGAYVTGQNTFVNNDSDAAGITADSVSIYLQSSNYLYRLQSVSIDTTFDRRDIREIGAIDVVARGVRDITNRVTLGRLLETYTIEEVLRGKAGLSYGKLDTRLLEDNLSLIIKVYSSSTKTSFLMGYKFTDLAPVSRETGTPVDDYVNAGTTLEGETAFVSSVESIL